jgi:molybdate-binding protein/DNA-binding XRE family transcriptional regulator
MSKTKPGSEITNKLAAIRKQRGLSASALAAAVGITRQTIYAVEAGTYIPNTATGLRLAQALGVRVDELFALAEAEPAPRPHHACLLPISQDLQLGQPVQLCEVNGNLVAVPSAITSWHLPPSDGVVASGKTMRGRTPISMHNSESEFENRLLVAGCDPAMGIVAQHLQAAGVELIAMQQNSSQSLALLKGGYVHLAGTHMRTNLGPVNRLFPAKSAALISFAVWQEGLVMANGNPKRIQSVEDLLRQDITFINREAGSGSRALLDSHLKKLGVQSEVFAGNLRTAPGHLAAAWSVKTGSADCCIATESAARFFGLHFMALESVRYDLVVRQQQLSAPRVELLLNVINELSFRRKLQNLGGYDTSVTGVRIQ